MYCEPCHRKTRQKFDKDISLRSRRTRHESCFGKLARQEIAHPTMVTITGTATSTKKQNFRPNDKRNASKNYFKLLCSLKIRTLSKTRTSGNLRITNMESLRRRCSFKLDNGIPQKEFAIPLKEVLIYNL